MPRTSAKEPLRKKAAKAKPAKEEKKAAPKKKPAAKKAPAKASPKRQKKAPFKKPEREEAPKQNITVDIIADEEEDRAPAYREIEYFSAEQLAASEADDLDEEEEASEDDPEEDYGKEDIDKQKNFFNEWANNLDAKSGGSQTVAPIKKSVGLYRRFAFGFVAMLAVIILAVLYFFIPTMTVTITPQGQTINDSLTFNVVTSSSTPMATSTATYATIDGSSYNKTVSGEIRETSVDATKTYQATGEEPGDQSLSGQVTLINTTANNQPLVATTRLLSADGKLFRLKNAVNIPAGGQVTADIYADRPGEDMAIGPSKFTIPGLWAGLQEKIYGQSSAAFTYNGNVKKVVGQSDLDAARQDIARTLSEKVKQSLVSQDPNTVLVYGSDSNPTVAFDAKAGDNRGEFTATAQKQVIVVAVPKSVISQAAQSKLSMLIPDDQQLTSFDDSQISYTLENYDAHTRTATIKAYFGGTITLKEDSKILDPQKLVGLNKDQVGHYLDGLSEIKEYQLQFSPSFITTAPNLVDRIKVKTRIDTSNN